MNADKDWKAKLGFPINYDSDQSSDGDADSRDVVMRRPRSSTYLLVDRGDGSEADLLGTTPPRERRRDKQKWKSHLDTVYLRDGNGKRVVPDQTYQQPTPEADRVNLKRHVSRKLQRARDRDMKVDIGQGKADSLPSPNAQPAVPTLVESCNRFMSLTSRLKCRESAPCDDAEPVEPRRAPVPGEECSNRANFHQTFSLLINMGNGEKGCRRTISREEQVWQNELKDLIWLELQARLARRSLAQQDAYLCARRAAVPAVLQRVRDYRFVNSEPCVERERRLDAIAGSRDDLSAELGLPAPLTPDTPETPDDDYEVLECLSFRCQRCTDAVGRGMREVAALLDAFHAAAALYPSTKALTADQPLVATHLFQSRLKAMCLWYNTAHYMRLKVLAVRRMLRTMASRGRRRTHAHAHGAGAAQTDEDTRRESSECRPCQVRFNVSTTPTDSNNSDSSAHSDGKGSSGSEHDTITTPETGEPGEERDTDEVDSGIEKRLSTSQSGQTTPEIVISDRYGTSDTAASSESGYSTATGATGTSAAAGGVSDSDGPHDVYDVGSLEDMTRLRLLDRCPVSPFRSYHHEMLKTQGVRRCMTFMNKMRLNVLHKVYETLEKPDRVAERLPEETPVEVFDDTREEDEPAHRDEDAQRRYERQRYGCWSPESLSMRLPSYRSHFLLLGSVCMEAVHDYLSLRLEGRPLNPSCLTVKQLIHELKEGLDIATEMRVAFARNIEVALSGHAAGAGARRELLLLVRTYDATVETVFKQYLSYLRTMSAVEQLSRPALQAEWAFTARLAKRVRCAATLAPGTFSEIACNQLNRILRQFDTKFTQIEELKKNDADPSKDIVYALCREAQSIYASEREATLQAAQWARGLAGRLQRAPPPAYTAQRAAILNSLMSLRDRLSRQAQYILEHSAPHDEREYDSAAARVRELLLQVYKLGFELHKELHRFAQAPFKLVAEKCERRRRPASLQPARAQPAHAHARRPRPETMLVHDTYNPVVHKELHRFVADSSSRGPAPGVVRRAAGAGAGARGKFLRADSIGEDVETSVFDDRLFDNINHFGDQQCQTSIEMLLSGEAPPAERAAVSAGAVEAPVSAEERLWATRVARAVVEFARCWMQFVVQRCDPGRGLRPRWASQGLEFLMLACDPCNTKHLTDCEFEELKKQMDGCISHVVGSRPVAPRAPEPVASPDPARRARPRHSPMSSHSSTSTSKDVPTPPTPPIEPAPLLSFQEIEPEAHNRRVLEAVRQLDASRDGALREARAVGRVLESAAVNSYEPKLRQLQFKWQRGLKIGAGTFGKVYTVVNTESGQLLAMKELSIGAGDRRALQRAANELRVLEGVVHPHLVRYYGCELHREEMLLFMELCVEGSLEALVATSGALAEHTARRYTRQLLSAVLELHNRAIAHRDIKSGNIFLTNEGHCLKLGDFGCAVKIRANTTAAGELQGCVGTQAYMAPEVFMKSSGHGRAADIWSLGCVVTEMTSGKRPWSEYDSNYQIMFVVGMGGRPAVPEALSEEGRQFCLGCLTHEPEQRPRAEQLMLHHFLMVKSDDDDECEPAYLLT